MSLEVPTVSIVSDPGSLVKVRRLYSTSIQAARHVVAFAGGALKQRSGPDDLRAGPAGLSLRTAAVAKLGAQAEELLRGGLGGHESVASNTH